MDLTGIYLLGGKEFRKGKVYHQLQDVCYLISYLKKDKLKKNNKQDDKKFMTSDY